ncbi:hypothetical protein [Mediterraneibacter gnavus]|uniref:hypothetical protein n=1 Tax=Mediterraneibacter gnavus TaxID=33038 RepID=UPI0036D4075D
MLSKDLLQQFEDNITRFDENIHAFENGEIDRQTFKGISGGLEAMHRRNKDICCVFVFRAVILQKRN